MDILGLDLADFLSSCRAIDQDNRTAYSLDEPPKML
jgi:hypothetical protein